jgi:hypothetical protein
MADLTNSVNPLSWNVPIVDKLGRATLEFQLKWEQQARTNGSIPDLTTAAKVSAVLDEIGSTRGSILARGASAWGPLAIGGANTILSSTGSDPAWSSLSSLLDTLGSARGDILFRGAGGWAVLAPGTATNVLTSAGAGADPTWSPAAGGGAAVSSVNDDGTNFYIALMDANGQLILDGAGDPVFLPETFPPAAIPAAVPYPTGYRRGGTTSNNAGTPNTKIDIAAFTGRDSTDTVNIKTAGTLTIDAAAVGANGLDAGSLANTTSYFSFVIQKADGTTASLLSTSPTAPTLPSGYLYFRRVGSHRTDGSAHFLAYIQNDKNFNLAASVQDLHSVNPGTSAITTALSVPLGIIVFPMLTVNWVVDGSITFLISPIVVPDLAPSFPATMTGAVTGATAGGTFVLTHIPTNTSGQVRSRTNFSDAGVTLNLVTAGWIDPLLD